MKKLLILAALLIITLTSCSSDDNSTSTGGLTDLKITTNRVVSGGDATNDGIDNFIFDANTDSQVIWFFDYKVADKQIKLSCLVNNVKTEVYVFTVDSEKNGDLKCHLENFFCTFRFMNTEVYQIEEISSGKKVAKFYFK